jgi:aspartate/methionine/tyrosine aminotransferase
MEVLGEDGSGIVVTRPSWEYDWFIDRAGKKLVELQTRSPDFLPDPAELDALLAKGGISSVIINNPHNPTGRVYPKKLVEQLIDVCVKRKAYVLYDSVYQRLDYIDAFVNPAYANPEWRHWVITLSGLSKMDMFGASTGARACWMVLSDEIKTNGVRAREVIANLSAWLVANPSTLAQDWAVAALQSPLAGLRRPSPYMRERRDYMAQAADELKSLGVERTAFEGTFYSPLAFPGLVGEKFERRRNGVRERAVVKTSEDAFDFLLSGGVGGIPFAAFAGSKPELYGTWQRLSYGSKDVKELTVFMARVKERIERQGKLGSSAPSATAAPVDQVWNSLCTEAGYDALDGLDKASFEHTRKAWLATVTPETLRLTGTKHPDSTSHRTEQLARAEKAGEGDAKRALSHLEWHPLIEARQEFDETLADLLGSCNEVLLDYEGRTINPE